MRFDLIDYSIFSRSRRWSADYFLSTLKQYRKSDGFELRKIGDLSRERSEFINPNAYENVTFNYVGLENISRSTRCLVDFVPRKGSEIKSRSKIFRNGDVLYGRLRPALNKCLVVDDHLTEGVCSTEIFVLVINPDLVQPEYFAELLVSNEVRTRVRPLVVGAALPRLQLSDFLDISLPIPEMEIQIAVVAELVRAREDFKAHARKAREIPKNITRAFGRHVFGGEAFALSPLSNQRTGYWHNPLPVEAQAANQKALK